MHNLSLRLLTLMSAAAIAQAAGTFTIAGPSSALSPQSGSWNWENGSNTTKWRNGMANTANFGPSGIVTTSINQVVLSTINAGTLAGINAFVSPWWFDDASNSAPFDAVLQTYFLGGGSLILLDDSTGRDGIATLLGLGTGPQGTQPWTALGAALTGPFGNPGSIAASGEIGTLSAAAIAAHGGSICATNTNNQPTAACFARGAYAPGAGAMIIVADIDTWTSQADFNAVNGNARFALNGTAFIVTGGAGSPSTPPAASGVPTLGEWGMVILAASLIAFGSLMASRRSHTQA